MDKVWTGKHFTYQSYAWIFIDSATPHIKQSHILKKTSMQSWLLQRYLFQRGKQKPEAACAPITRGREQTPRIHTTARCAHGAVSKGLARRDSWVRRRSPLGSLRTRGKAGETHWVKGQDECGRQTSCTQPSGVKLTRLPCCGLTLPTPRKHTERPGGALQGHISLHSRGSQKIHSVCEPCAENASRVQAEQGKTVTVGEQGWDSTGPFLKVSSVWN